MGIEDDTGNMVTGAIALGMILEQKSSDARSSDHWFNQAMHKQAQINNLVALTNTQDRIIAAKKADIAEKDRLLAENQRILAETRAQLELTKEYLENSIGNVSGLLKMGKDYKVRLVSQSAQTKGMHALYEKLISEIQLVSNPALFPSLNPEQRRALLEKEISDWISTGKVRYIPAFQDEQPPTN